MNEIVQYLNQSFYTFSVVSIGASLVWGILSVFLSPCHVASIPLVIGYINNSKKPDLKGAFKLSLLFGLGILLMILLMGIITGFLGRILGDVGTPLMVLVYIFLTLCGIWLLDLPFGRSLNLPFLQKGLKAEGMGAFSLGFLYGLVLGPCSFAFLAPMIGFVFSQSMSQLWFGIALFFFYGIGHTLAIVVAGTFGNKIVNRLESGNFRNASLWIKRICGIFIIVYSIFKIIELNI
ncbi:cytochrome C biogenesis protein [Oceanispirochaeta crateris]|uniref:Cytochrome C biogenesis protein n=1 Tax=Oceanispirochaeta crateris TaxID=2518645 RepID=A0A5C1QJB7_9SPIO|nr:cytochrome c biogenesis protein CcdA [Oceanispirochaeta crateris]QEN07090.1 cytochrome C biogenesis protein [Oceanispirochaeta crateris]